MKYLLASLFSLSLMLGTAGAYTLEDRLLAHMRWIAENSRFDESPQVPAVKPTNREDWRRNGWHDLAAVYHQGTVYVPDFDDTDDPTWVHELVHHYQWLNGELPPGYCPGDHEPEAYALQEQWQQEMGMGGLTNAEKWHKIHSQGMCRFRDRHGP